jgi:hypothetical protein
MLIPSDPTLMTMALADLVQLAHAHGVRFFLSSVISASYPIRRLMIWNQRDPDRQRIVVAMRCRRDEITAYLSAHRPAPVTVDPAEDQYRRDVRGELDIPVSELPLPALLSIVRDEVHRTVHRELAAARTEQASSPPPSPPMTRSPKAWPVGTTRRIAVPAEEDDGR